MINSLYSLLKKESNAFKNQSYSSKNSLRKDLDMVDWQILLLINKIEAKFKIAIPDDEIGNIDTIENLALMVARQKKHHSYL